MVRHPLELAAGRRVPDPDRLIGRAGRDPTAIIGEIDRRDRARRALPGSRAILPSATFQIRAVLSAEPVTSLVPSRLMFSAEHGVAMPREIADRLALVDVPELGGLVGRRRDDEVAILGRKGQGVNAAGVPLELLDRLGVGGIDHADRVVLAGDGELGTVASKRQGRDRRREPFDFLDLLAVGDAIDPHGLVGECRRRLASHPAETRRRRPAGRR